MSPWRMMNEWGIPTVHLECLTHQICGRLKAKGAYIPPIAIGGGLGYWLATQVFDNMIFFYIGLIFGIIAGFRNVYMLGKKYQDKQ